MSENNPDEDWLFNKKIDEKPDVEKEKKNKRKKHRNKRKVGSKIKYKLKNLRYKLFRRRYRRISFSPGLFLSLFIPLLVGLLILYLLEPGLSLMLQYGNLGFGIEWVLLFLIIPAEVNSYVPWIAWIASGFAGGFISGRVLIPFLSMYILLWILLFVFAGDWLTQGFGYLSGFGLEQIIIQRLVINFIFAILAFGFGGWIGASIRGR